MTMISQNCKIAIVEVGESQEAIHLLERLKNEGNEVELYSYPEDTTEFEFDDEVRHLKEFYDIVLLVPTLPPHIRYSVAARAIYSKEDY